MSSVNDLIERVEVVLWELEANKYFSFENHFIKVQVYEFYANSTAFSLIFTIACWRSQEKYEVYSMRIWFLKFCRIYINRTNYSKGLG